MIYLPPINILLCGEALSDIPPSYNTNGRVLRGATRMQLLEVGMQSACQMPLPLFACRYTMGFTWEYPPSSPFCSTLMCMQRGHTKPDSMQTGGVLNGSGCHSCIVCGYNPMYSVPGAQPLCTPTFHMPRPCHPQDGRL